MFELFTSPGTNDISLPAPSNTPYVDLGLAIILTLLLIQSIWRTDQLIGEAKVNFLVDRVTAIAHATREFQKLYQALPGDFAYASVHIDSSLLNGNGNGKIDTDQERGQAWAHLAGAALMPHLRVDGGPVLKAVELCPLSRCPDNTRGQGVILSYGQSGLSFTHAGNELLMGNNIPLETLAGLDAFIDDGGSKTGLVQLHKRAEKTKLANCHYSPFETPKQKHVHCAGVVKLL